MRKGTLLNRILVRCGAYYHPADLFYLELWKQRLVSIGFRVLLSQPIKTHGNRAVIEWRAELQATNAFIDANEAEDRAIRLLLPKETN